MRIIKKFIAIFLIGAISLALTGCGAITGKTTPEKKKFVPTANMQVVDTQTGDLDGDGKEEKVDLYVDTAEKGLPAWKLVVDEFEMAVLDSQDGAYTLSDFNLQDVDGENGLEILCYRYNTGSAGGQGLNIYKYTGDGWQELFNAPNTFDTGKGRFAVEYLGDYRVSFEDWKTGLKHTILLDESMYKGNEALLENIDTWVDPISEYKVVDKDNNGVCEVTSIQRVIGIAHVDTIASLQTTYRMGKEYQPATITLVDINGKVLAEKKI